MLRWIGPLSCLFCSLESYLAIRNSRLRGVLCACCAPCYDVIIAAFAIPGPAAMRRAYLSEQIH